MTAADPPIYTITPAEYRMRIVVGWIAEHSCHADPCHPRRLGHPPTIREAAEYAGLSSSRTVFILFNEMQRLGFIRWQVGRVRTIEALEGPPLGIVARPPHRDPHHTPRLDRLGERRH